MFLYGSKSPVQKRIINAKQSHEIEVDTGEIVLEETLLKEIGRASCALPIYGIFD